MLTKKKNLKIMQEVEETEKAEKKTPLQQRRIKGCSVLEIGSVRKFVARNEGNDNIKYNLSAEELYDVIDTAHLAVGHGGHDRMLAKTYKNFADVTKEMIHLFSSMCCLLYTSRCV